MKGHAKIVLCDSNTGDVVKEVESDNLVTNAVDNLVNSMIPYTLRRSREGGMTKTPFETVFGNISDTLVKTFYGGLMVFSSPITELEDHIIPTTSEAMSMIGSGSGDARIVGSKIHGSFNEAESSIDTENGVATFVWDFETDQCNGDIAAICLTSLMGGHYGWNTDKNDSLAISKESSLRSWYANTFVKNAGDGIHKNSYDCFFASNKYAKSPNGYSFGISNSYNNDKYFYQVTNDSYNLSSFRMSKIDISALSSNDIYTIPYIKGNSFDFTGIIKKVFENKRYSYNKDDKVYNYKRFGVSGDPGKLYLIGNSTLFEFKDDITEEDFNGSSILNFGSVITINSTNIDYYLSSLGVNNVMNLLYNNSTHLIKYIDGVMHIFLVVKASNNLHIINLNTVDGTYYENIVDLTLSEYAVLNESWNSKDKVLCGFKDDIILTIGKPGDYSDECRNFLINAVSLEISKNISFITSTRADRNGSQYTYIGPIDNDNRLAKEPVLFIDSYISGSYYYRRPVICMNYLGTINNMDTVLTKTIANTMKVIYTLTEIYDVEPEPEPEPVP